jgi:hypothetical protein
MEVALRQLIGQQPPIDLTRLAKNDARWINALFAITNGPLAFTAIGCERVMPAAWRGAAFA